MTNPPKTHDDAALRAITDGTIGHYDGMAEDFWAGTRGHDVSQNRAALVDAIEGDPPFSILDFGCGPGRDLMAFRAAGHNVAGLDGTAEFVAMARRMAGCEVLHQDFLALELPASRFDGIFANASLFHVPRQELPRVLRELHAALKPRGVLFSSNPLGDNQEGWVGGRFGCFSDLETWRDNVSAAGFEEVDHYYRPPGKPRHEQFWLASVWRKGSNTDKSDTAKKAR